MTKSDIGYDYNEEQPQNPYVILSLIAVLVVAVLTYAGDGTSQQIASGQECAAMDRDPVNPRICRLQILGPNVVTQELRQAARCLEGALSTSRATSSTNCPIGTGREMK